MLKPFARCLVRDADNRYLVVKNLARGRYEFPGGKMEEGEEAADCIRRELEEEVGLFVIDLKYIGEREVAVETGDWVGYFFLCTAYAGEAKIQDNELSKLADLRWVTEEELAGLPQIPRVGVDILRASHACL